MSDHWRVTADISHEMCICIKKWLFDFRSASKISLKRETVGNNFGFILIYTYIFLFELRMKNSLKKYLLVFLRVPNNWNRMPGEMYVTKMGLYEPPPWYFVDSLISFNAKMLNKNGNWVPVQLYTKHWKWFNCGKNGAQTKRSAQHEPYFLGTVIVNKLCGYCEYAF